MENYRYCVVYSKGLDQQGQADTGTVLQYVKDAGPIQCVYRKDDGTVKAHPLSRIRVFETQEEADKSCKAHNKTVNKGGENV